MVTQFEKAFAKFAGAKHAIAVNTGTAALHAAIAAVGDQGGDEVILPSFTFVATAEAVVLAGGNQYSPTSTLKLTIFRQKKLTKRSPEN